MQSVDPTFDIGRYVIEKTVEENGLSKADHLKERNHNSYIKYRPFPIRLGELKTKLQTDAFEKGSTIHAVALSILKNYYERKKIVLNYYNQKGAENDIQLNKLVQLAQLLELQQIKRYNLKHHIYRKKYGDMCYQLRIWA